MDKQDEIEGLAILIRDLRKHKNVTLGDLATRIDRSVGFLSQVERGLSRPTVADLTAISEALGVPTTYFYSLSKPREIPWVTRPDERRTLYYAGGITDVLASPTMSGGFSMLESHLEPGATSGEGHLDDSSEQGRLRPRRRADALVRRRRRAGDPLRQRQLPAAAPCAVPLRQPLRTADAGALGVHLTPGGFSPEHPFPLQDRSDDNNKTPRSAQRSPRLPRTSPGHPLRRPHLPGHPRALLRQALPHRHAGESTPAAR